MSKRLLKWAVPWVFLFGVGSAVMASPVLAETGRGVARDPGAAGSSATVDRMATPLSPTTTVVTTEEGLAAWLYAEDQRMEQWLRGTFGEGSLWLLETVGQNAVWRFFAAGLTILLLLAFRRWVLGLALRMLKEAAQRTSTDLDEMLLDALSGPVTRIVTIFALYAGTLWLVLTEGARGFALAILRILVVVFVAQGIYRSIRVVGVAIDRYAADRDLGVSIGMRQLILRFLRVVVWFLAAVFVVQELGYNVGGLLAGLGVGGLAVALAARDTLANWFGALMIFTDRPFAIGDWIKTGNLEGTVEEIGLRSTKVRTFARTLVSVPNSTLANDVVENFSRMPVRRVSYTLGVTYATTPDMMRESLERIRETLRDHPAVDQTFWLVRFTDFGASSLDIMVYYFTKTTVWDQYLQAREDINLRIMERLSEIGVSVAFPTRSVYLEKTDQEELARLDAEAKRHFEARGRRVRAEKELPRGAEE